MDHASQAKDLMAQAQKKITSYSFFGSKTQKYEDAGEMYKKAANLFKMAKQDNEAASAFLEAANCFSQAPNNQHEVATCYVKASGCYKKESYLEAISALKKAVNLYATDGRFGMAAKHEKDIAELFENNGDTTNAMTHYETAAHYFEGENSTSTANGCLLKVATFAAEAKDYAKAIKIFEEVSQSSINNKLLQYSVKEYLLKASLCNLCTGDLIETKKALTRYMALDHTFMNSREGKLVSAITDAYDNGDEETFCQILEEYEQITPFDPWKRNLLTVIQENIKKEAEDSGGEVL